MTQNRKTAFSRYRAAEPVWRNTAELANAVDDYFRWRESEKLPPTYTGLCLYLGISMHVLRVCMGAEKDAKVLAKLSAKKWEQACEVLCYAGLRIQSYAEEQLYLKGSWHAGEKICAMMDGSLSPAKDAAEADVRFELPEALAPYTV